MQGPSTTPPDDCLAPTLAALGDRPRTAIDRLAGLGFRAVQLSASQPGKATISPVGANGPARDSLVPRVRIRSTASRRSAKHPTGR